MFKFWLDSEEGNQATENEKPSKITTKIGNNLTIPCHMEYNLTFFAWFFCESDCVSSKSWELVVKVDHGSFKISNPQKFGYDKEGALILKDVQPSNNNNWVRCFYKERYVGTYHRTTIIRIIEGNNNALFFNIIFPIFLSILNSV